MGPPHASPHFQGQATDTSPLSIRNREAVVNAEDDRWEVNKALWLGAEARDQRG